MLAKNASKEVLQVLEMMHTGKVKKQPKAVFERISQVATLLEFEFDSNMKKPSEKVALLEKELFGENMGGTSLTNLITSYLSTCTHNLTRTIKKLK